MRRGAEVELGRLDVFGRHERGLDQEKLIDGPALDWILNDLNFALRSKSGAAPKQQQGQR
jgi:hypothetical protein